MQRLFSNFPAGAPGLGLLTLRLVVAGCLIAEGGERVHGSIAAAPVLAGAFLLCAGALTACGVLSPLVYPVVAVVTTAALAVTWWTNGWLAADLGSSALVAATALALALIGPGAYSLDARLFGRREIIIGSDQSPLSSDPQTPESGHAGGQARS